MSEWTIRTDRDKLTTSVMEAVHARGTIRLSDMFLKLWCGRHEPTEELEGYLSDRGFRIERGLDHHAGWQVTEGPEVLKQEVGQAGLFGAWN